MIEKLYSAIELIEIYNQKYNLSNINPEYLNKIRGKINEIKFFEERIKKLNIALEKVEDEETQTALLIELHAVMNSMADLFEEINDIKWRILSNLPDENEK